MSEQAAIDAEMDAALDGILGAEEEHEVNDIIEEVIDNDPDPKEQDEDPIEDEVVKKESTSPPGHMGYDEYVAAGNDPKKYRGEDAYSAEYDRIQEIKSLKSDFSGLQDTMSHIAGGMDEWRQQQTETIRSQVLTDLETAKEEGNTDDALAAQEKLNKLDTKPAPKQQPQINPLITEFREKNPLADKSSGRYNADYTDDLEAIYDNTVRSFGGNVTQRQVATALKDAQRQAKGLHPDLFESPRNNRPTVNRQTKKPAAKVTDHRAALAGIGNNKNSGDSNAAQDIYDMIKNSGGEEAAINFSKTHRGIK